MAVFYFCLKIWYHHLSQWHWFHVKEFKVRQLGNFLDNFWLYLHWNDMTHLKRNAFEFDENIVSCNVCTFAKQLLKFHTTVLLIWTNYLGGICIKYGYDPTNLGKCLKFQPFLQGSYSKPVINGSFTVTIFRNCMDIFYCFMLQKSMTLNIE